MSNKVKVYSAEWCAGCRVVKSALVEAGIEHVVLDVCEGEGLQDAKKYGIRSIPVTFIGDERVNGSSVADIKKIMELYERGEEI